MVKRVKPDFSKRVIKRMGKDGWILDKKTVHSIFFFHIPDSKYSCIVKIKAHGRIKKKEWEYLHSLGAKCKCHVLLAHEAPLHEIVFVRIYPRY